MWAQVAKQQILINEAIHTCVCCTFLARLTRTSELEIRGGRGRDKLGSKVYNLQVYSTLLHPLVHKYVSPSILTRITVNFPQCITPNGIFCASGYIGMTSSTRCVLSLTTLYPIESDALWEVHYIFSLILTGHLIWGQMMQVDIDW